MEIRQGDVFWLDHGESPGSGPAYLHPYVVIQNNMFNKSRINTVIICSLTSNLKRAKSPGNVLLERGEANLPRQSVINITQIFTVDKQDLAEKIGTLSRERIFQVLRGIELVITPGDVDQP